MKINFFKAKELEKPIRLSVHRSGNLGFTREAEEKLKLADYKAVAIGKNAEDENDDSLYMLLFTEDSEDAFKLGKSSDYYYAATKLLFDNLGINYQNGGVAFDMTRITLDDDQTAYKLEQIIKTKPKDSKDDKKE